MKLLFATAYNTLIKTSALHISQKVPNRPERKNISISGKITTHKIPLSWVAQRAFSSVQQTP